MARQRSPNYPVESFPDAIERTRRVYDKEKQAAASGDVIAEHIGYTGLNGKSRRVISAMSDYGLLQSVEDGYKVSDDALDILLLPSGDPTHRDAVRRLAFRPKVFAQLREDYGRELPSEINLKHKLIKSGFTDSAAEDVISNYLATVAVADPAGEGPHTPEAHFEMDGEAQDAVVNDAGERSLAPKASSDKRQGHAPVRASALGSRPREAVQVSETSEVRLSPNCRVVLSFEGPVTQAAINKLIAFLEWNRDSYPDDLGGKGVEAGLAADLTA